MTYKNGELAFVTALNRREPYLARYDGHLWRDVDHDSFHLVSPLTIEPVSTWFKVRRVAKGTGAGIGMALAFILLVLLTVLLPDVVRHALGTAVALIGVTVYVTQRRVVAHPITFSVWVLFLLVDGAWFITDLAGAR